MAVAQQMIVEELLPLLKGIEGKTVLEIGSGTGLLTKKLSFKEIDALDLSAGMLSYASKRIKNVNFIKSGFLEYKTDKKYDLIVSSSTLHWMDLREAKDKIESLLNPAGTYVLSIILDGTLGELHSLRKEVAPNKLPLKKLPCSEEIKSVFPSFFEKEFVVYYNSAVEFFSAIKKLGVTGGDFSRAKTPLSRAEIDEISRKYEERYGDRLPATYKSAFIVKENAF